MYVSVCTYVYACTGTCFSVCRCVSNVSYGHVCTCLYARVLACARVCVCVNPQGRVGKTLGIKDHSAGSDVITQQTYVYACSGPAQTCLALSCVDGSGRGNLITIFFSENSRCLLLPWGQKRILFSSKTAASFRETGCSWDGSCMILGPGQKVHLRLVSLEATLRPAELRRGWGEPKGSLSASLLNTVGSRAGSCQGLPGCPSCSPSPVELVLRLYYSPTWISCTFKGVHGSST